jgi:hypothetical protein
MPLNEWFYLTSLKLGVLPERLRYLAASELKRLFLELHPTFTDKSNALCLLPSWARFPQLLNRE